MKDHKMSNLDAIKRKFEKAGKEIEISVPSSSVKRKDKKCPECGESSMVKGFCMVCGYEEKS